MPVKRKRKKKHPPPPLRRVMPGPEIEIAPKPRVVRPTVHPPSVTEAELRERLDELAAEERRLVEARRTAERTRKTIAAARGDMPERAWTRALERATAELEILRFRVDRVREEMAAVREELAH